ncbi:ABC transporter permease [Emticicia sp. CRIBPO]|jgi:phospholipid/cholesterol/gamma-HCH transport system permease protein|uniref:MlaE family ABC transporter permease n=1 Tax=Emticicia sp. CRIBPO TaxID=2683258 RepID=UPI0014136B1A|nr:ABC transporter permease [Emticicia sp. CRIBPO]NBA86451.1 ABC transporter permease [Emticicia sp. CRIBPO]
MFSIIGKFFIFIGSLFIRRESSRVYWKRFIDECVSIGIGSVNIISIVALFIGAVVCVQTYANLVSPIIPKYIVSNIVRDMTLLELSSTFMCVVLAGKVGSNIAGELGTMRITEQIDALEVMGINSASYLVLPKVLAAIFTFPLLAILSGFLGIMGGYLAGTLSGILTPEQYIYGIRFSFIPFNVTIAIIKSIVFGFLIATISAYKGFNTKGGALEVGQASTAAVTNSCIAVLIADYLLAELLT